ncbi:hypothetical protein B9Z55_017126 [Caenorhabditis nigoni]|uniref:Uncharacterized protein n=1 Tax=Caenorhabditis nigoni TaxID=1611254 RepID=A0A2G5T7Q1_9PELO|nr:hypothetical protein B9Z55_017126 [Caenorhabditis nigoni]
MQMEYEQQLPVNGDLAASIALYALYYTKNDNIKRCAIPLTTRFAAIHRHGENKSIKQGDEIVIRSWFDKKLEVSTRAVKFIEVFDTIILQSDGVDLCDKDLMFNSIKPRKGMRYLMMGFSIDEDTTNYQSFSSGIITNEDVRWRRYTGSTGSFEGGGGCWSESGQLMGMQIEDEASEGPCCIIAVQSIWSHILDLIPDSESEEDWDEEDWDE